MLCKAVSQYNIHIQKLVHEPQGLLDHIQLSPGL